MNAYKIALHVMNSVMGTPDCNPKLIQWNRDTFVILDVGKVGTPTFETERQPASTLIHAKLPIIRQPHVIMGVRVKDSNNGDKMA